MVGIAGDDEGITANVSYDGCAVDEQLVGVWKEVLGELMEGDEEGSKARL